MRSFSNAFALPLLLLTLLSSNCYASSGNSAAPLLHMLLALGLIIGFARLCGRFFQRTLGQPLITGEIIAGILLSPALLGQLAPHWHAQLFPSDILPFLNMLASLGVVLFMFLMGMQMNPAELRSHAPAAVAVASGGMALPMLAGVALACLLYADFAPAATSPFIFGFFFCIALGVTAFPVLARLIDERGLSQTPAGTIALTAAALGDVLAWGLLLSCIVLSGQGQQNLAGSGASALALIMLLTLAWRWFRGRSKHNDSQQQLALIVAGLFLTCAAAEGSGLHAAIGAFLFGLVLPHDSTLARSLRPQIEQVAVSLLLPVFFSMLGLQLLLHDIGRDDLLAFSLIMLVAMGGKILGCYVAARLSRQPASVAGQVAILMNTRGLMELVVLKIGLDLHFINQKLFTLMVLMAVLTTLMTPLLLDLFAARHRFAALRNTPS